MANVSSVQTQVAGSGSVNQAQAAVKGSALFAGKGIAGANGFLGMLMQIVAPTPVTGVTNTAPAVDGQAAATTPINLMVTDVAQTGVQMDTDVDDIDEAALAAMLPAQMSVPVASQIPTDGISDDGDANASAPVIPGTVPADAAEDMGQNELDAMSAQLRAQLAALGVVSDEMDTQATTTAVPGTDVTEVITVPKTTDPKSGLPIITSDSDADKAMAEQLNAIAVGAGEVNTSAKEKTHAKTLDVLNSILGKQTALDGQIDQVNLANAYKSTVTNEAKIDGTPLQTTLSDAATSVTGHIEMGDDMIAANNSEMDASAAVQTAAVTTPSTPQATSATAVATGHAVAHAVAAQLTQMAQNKETKSLTLQLNPPELGKMQVKMTFGRDKSVRADISVEKSDTYNMLQKDSDTLTQALKDAGLSADAGSLNFTLADQGTFADQSGQGNASSGASYTNDNGDEVSIIEIKSSEEWSVDPGTGIVRYNIMV